MKVSPWIVPFLIVVLAAAGVGGARMLAIPSVSLDYPGGEAETVGPVRTAVFLVDGVKCVDTAERAASALEEVPGVIRFVAYASRNRVEVTYDQGRTDTGALRDALEGPVWDEASGEFLFGQFEVLEIDGRPVS